MLISRAYKEKRAYLSNSKSDASESDASESDASESDASESDASESDASDASDKSDAILISRAYKDTGYNISIIICGEMKYGTNFGDSNQPNSIQHN